MEQELESLGEVWKQVVAAMVDLVIVPHVDVAASMLASASASHDCDGWLPVQGHTLGTEHPYIDGSDSTRISNSHSVEQDTFDPYTPQCVSIVASYLHSGGSQDICHPRADTSLRDATRGDAVVDVATLAADLTLGALVWFHFEPAPRLELEWEQEVELEAQAQVGIDTAGQAPVVLVQELE